MGKKWVFKPLPDEEQVLSLSKELNMSSAIGTLLMQRNITTSQQGRDYFRPSLEKLHDPFLMKDMNKAVWRIEEAIRNREKIMIYGDYDVDGTTSVALVYGFLRNFYPNLVYYTPDRYDEGYGISIKGIDWAKEQGVKLIICLDCGIKALQQIAYAAELGIEFIVCDHHRPGDELPEAYAILDPKRSDCTYPYNELSGCGIGFKLLHALCINNNLPLERLYSFLDLVAVSIGADIVPIDGENRILAHFGLKKLNLDPRPGLKALIEGSGLKRPIDISSIVFGIAPRINASGRISHAKHAIKLLMAEDQQEADDLATLANTNNEQRRGYDSHITQEAFEMIERTVQGEAPRSTVLFKQDWHKGVIGIVASRCIEKYYRPTIILTESNNKATGSARSVQGFDIYEAIAACSDLLEQYGGHMYAAGLTLPLDNLDAFKERFEQVVAQKIKEEHLLPQYTIDMKISLEQISFKFYKLIQQMAPFGPTNMQPVFVSEGVHDDGNARVLKGDHLRMYLRQGSSMPIEAIGFGMASYYEDIKQGQPFDICYHINENDYRGRVSLQLVLKDIKPRTER